jgi:hypothetical protein
LLGPAVLADGRPRSITPVGDEDAVEVVELVLEDRGVVALGVDLEWLAAGIVVRAASPVTG